MVCYVVRLFCCVSVVFNVVCLCGVLCNCVVLVDGVFVVVIFGSGGGGGGGGGGVCVCVNCGWRFVCGGAVWRGGVV